MCKVSSLTNEIQMDIKKKYWENISRIKKTGVEQKEKNDHVSENDKLQRRDFLKYLGFSTLAVSLAACEGPVKKAIPYVVQPEEVIPGEPSYYASSINDGFDYAPVLVKTREGRPINIIINDLATRFQDINSRILSSTLSLYDINRFKAPKHNNKQIKWEDLDKIINEKLEYINKNNKKIVFLTPSIFSPSTISIIDKFSKKYKNFEHIEYDAISYQPHLDAFEELYGIRALPTYELSKSKLIVGFESDFLSTNTEGLEKSYVKTRVPNQGMSHHIQFESNMSLTGANADKRIPLKPIDQEKAIISLYKYLYKDTPIPKEMGEDLKKIAIKLKKSNGDAIVLSGHNKKNIQILTYLINEKISSKSYRPDKPIYTKKANLNKFKKLIDDMNTGDIHGIFCYSVNPSYNYFDSEKFNAALKKVPLKVGLYEKENETSVMMDYIAPTTHSLESWGDFNPVEGFYSLMQPTIKNVFDSRQFEDSLLAWLDEGKKYYDYLRMFWKNKILKGKKNKWNEILHNGVIDFGSTIKINKKNVDADQYCKQNNDKVGTQINLYTKTSMGDGTMADNPWLQEMPDPITRMCWDNYITISPKQAKELGIKNWRQANGALNGDKVNIKSKNKVIKNVPALIQAGQAYETVSLALGYGRDKVGKTGLVGVNAWNLYADACNIQDDIKIERTNNTHRFASVQFHDTMMGRDIVKETTLENYLNKPKEKWNKPKTILDHEGKKNVNDVDLWESTKNSADISPYKFNISIDLNSCIGCGACVIACHSENNVPVVGKEEVSKGRDMHWLRIDRYYSSDMNEEKAKKLNLGAIEKNAKMEVPSENPEVSFQPMMCQHCNHAPCETVCPVGATTHGAQGQNQMTYNRCIGTRYCANNCPYKVRRFNWFKYSDNDKFDFNMNNDLGKMALNPDVTVRSRGVMEKCSMCIQITQAAILKAKNKGVKLQDKDLKTACASACNVDAIKIGNIKDKESDVTKDLKSDRSYHLLEELGTRPNVFYKLKVRNKKKLS